MADFVGLPAMTFLDATLKTAADGAPVAHIGTQSVRLDGYQFAQGAGPSPGPVTLGVRPERVLVGQAAGLEALEARRTGLEPHGADTLVLLDLDGQALTARVNPEIAGALDDRVHVGFDIEGVSLFDPDDGARI
ncbi:TOBE domain-containing protein [Roseisalinus antarcticus]|uniref:Glycerol-3-phosphate transporter ATP-binding subunit n=1 Tax=Roseisalinus antarcticus TaxID=254357 RepID=A0A1Y5TDG6_9RHOB|nr:TOBE domain-containing protein [Roseisalinus antarcticus]SLN61525.1 glycerol-3-phosphate transporter ATP-binding subunit [Roseisalinus antarcticus]